MGFFPVSRIEVRRVYTPDRKLVVTHRDDELGRDETKEFAFDDLAGALLYVKELLDSKSM